MKQCFPLVARLKPTVLQLNALEFLDKREKRGDGVCGIQANGTNPRIKEISESIKILTETRDADFCM